MKQIAQKLVERNYRRRILIILIAAAVLAVTVAVLIPVTLRKQIAELRAWKRAQEEQTDEASPAGLPDGQPKQKHRDREHEFKAVLRQLTPIGKGTKAAFAAVALLAFLLGVFYWITVAEWLYKTAVRNGLNRALWPMLGLLFNILTIPALLVVLCDPRRAGKQG